MDTNDDEEEDLPKYQLSTTHDKENNETKYPIYPDKPSHSTAAPTETDLPSPIDAITVVAK